MTLSRVLVLPLISMRSKWTSGPRRIGTTMSTSSLLGVELGLGLGLDVGVAGVAVERADALEVLHELGAVEVVAATWRGPSARRCAAAAERLDLLAVVVRS